MSVKTIEPLMWYEREFTPIKPVIFPDEKGINYGLGDFEGIRAEKASFCLGQPLNNTAIYALVEHVDRLFFSTRMLYMDMPYSREEIAEAIKNVVIKNNFKECYIRPLVWDATRKFGIHGKPEKVGVAIMAKPFGKYIDKGSEGLRLMISSIRRPHPDTTINEAKFIANYHNSFLATMEAHNAGYDEALLLDTRGMVSELPGANIMIIEREKIVTPPKCASILPGITRDTIMKMAKQVNWDLIEEDIPTGRLFRADAAFTCGTAMKVALIQSVNGHMIGDGYRGDTAKSRVKLIQEGYENIVTGQAEKWRNMLTYLYPES
jgi:branched-chain amino acid aminotransferase